MGNAVLEFFGGKSAMTQKGPVFSYVMIRYAVLAGLNCQTASINLALAPVTLRLLDQSKAAFSTSDIMYFS
jgi:hypothetical protein